MKKAIIRILLIAIMLLLFKAEATAQEKFTSFDRAKLHPIVCNRPAIDFFEGALLGNGGMGVVVTTRPDAIVLYFGHNNVWDIRIAENNREKIGTFKEVFNHIKSIPDTVSLLSKDQWYNEYSRMAAENYRKPYPRPFPCGSVLLGFDRRNAEMIGYQLDVSNGLCEVTMLTKMKKEVTLKIFTDMSGDQLWMCLVDKQGNPSENIFDRVRVMIDPSTPKEFPAAKIEEDLTKGVLSFRQILPSQEPDKYSQGENHPKDKAFRLAVSLNCPLEKRTWINRDNEQNMLPLEAGINKNENFVGYILLQQGMNNEVDLNLPEMPVPQIEEYNNSLNKNTQAWREYWNKSGVKLSDQFLEAIWYHNLYFLNCATKDGATTPGLFANWSYNNIGTSWHGDYHMNYNIEQSFWVTFSSNHLEKNLPYVNLIESLMYVSKRWANEYYELPGAYFPHSSYPVDMTMNPYPVPTWGWEICETPWAVQGLWWHYLYSGNIDFLKSRAFEPMKAAVEFLVAYMKRPDAHGPQWKDNKYHIFPTVPPELFGLHPGFKYNYDCNVDLALTKFVFKAFIQACKILNYESQENSLLNGIHDILSHFPDYPTTVSKKFGKIMVSVPGEDDQIVYNTPNALFTVFPGEDQGLHSDKTTLEILKNTFYNQQNEGGNDLVFLNLQSARIGMLDLEKFKRQINYCLMPNGTASDRVMQVHGRYNDLTNYGFMNKMGIWFENFALPAVINECLIQSYDGIIRIFPNWPDEKNAEFKTLRAVGGFLVSSSIKEGIIREIEIFSENDNELKIYNPWGADTKVKVITNGNERIISGNIIKIKVRRGQNILVQSEKF
jgi:hypothetical protein